MWGLDDKIHYRTRNIIIRGLYSFYPLFKIQKVFSRGFFLKILALCMVSIQERLLIKSGLCWCAYGILLHLVLITLLVDEVSVKNKIDVY
jgi:hypothetical protein